VQDAQQREQDAHNKTAQIQNQNANLQNNAAAKMADTQQAADAERRKAIATVVAAQLKKETDIQVAQIEAASESKIKALSDEIDKLRTELKDAKKARASSGKSKS
jgi:hypothetical protein